MASLAKVIIVFCDSWHYDLGRLYSHRYEFDGPKFVCEREGEREIGKGINRIMLSSLAA